MASVNFILKGKKNPANLYCRFTNTRSVDIWQSLNIYLDPSTWDHSKQLIKNVISVRNRDEINKKLKLLKIHIIDSFNFAYMEGEIIDRDWLNKSINDFFNRPTSEVKTINPPHTIYLTSFADWWLDNLAVNWITNNKERLNERAKSQYKSFVDMLKKFEGKHPIKLKDIDNSIINAFVDHLVEKKYAAKTISRHVNRFKFFCFRADENNFNVNNNFKQKVFVPVSEEIKEPFLNPEEIENIFKHDFSNNDKLDNVRDNLIIACWTGLRVSDFLNKLNISNFIDDYIEITTQKTKTPVVIPIHPMIKSILIKRNGQLPKKISDQKFNDYVKEVCAEVKINQLMKGRIYNKKEKRKITDIYEKHLLVTSHIGRRSFATNHFGKVPNQVIMKVCGWSSEAMMFKYIKKSDKSYAVELEKYWQTQYN